MAVGTKEAQVFRPVGFSELFARVLAWSHAQPGKV
jgi:hypothetical protein